MAIELEARELHVARARVFRAMWDWERTSGLGQARTIFDRAYTQALLDLHIGGLLDSDRGQLWQEWLVVGALIPPDERRRMMLLDATHKLGHDLASQLARLIEGR